MFVVEIIKSCLKQKVLQLYDFICIILGTGAKAWEFESLHAQIKGNDGRSFFYVKFLFVHRPLTQDCCSVFATIGVLPVRVSCLVRLILFAYDASESLHAHHLKLRAERLFFSAFYCWLFWEIGVDLNIAVYIIFL